MRVAGWVALVLLSSCAAEHLALTPPTGVDFSGKWRLNEADSDDPQRLVMSQLSGPQTGTGQAPGGGGRGGRGGGPAGGAGSGAPALPPLPAVAALSQGLRWPGKDMEIKQVAGVVAITSSGESRVYQPAPGGKRPHWKPPDDEAGRDARPRVRGEGPPPRCGWDDKTLVVQSVDPDEDHPPFEQRFSVSEDGQRMIEVIGFTGGRAQGFTMSRVWDRAP